VTLVDVNVWVAALFGWHPQNRAATQWLNEQEDEELAFCRVTELALLRHLTNPAVARVDVRTRRQAWDLLLELQQDPRVRFVSEPPGLATLWMAFSKRDDYSLNLWTDGYLAAFAQAAHADLVTFDRSMHGRYPSVKIVTLAP
jgi:toxin-antitoxin system PIN domain toxin